MADRAKQETRPASAKLEPQTGAKPEPQPLDPSGPPAPPAPPAATTGATASTRGRGRGRGRARGRGRRVVPRQVARRKPPPTAVRPEPGPERRGRRGRGGRGRGDAAAGRGRGGMRPAPTYAPNVVGLGQIAPARVPSSRVASSGGSAATSRKSSAVSSMSLGAASSTNAASSSTGAEVLSEVAHGFGDGRNVDGSFSGQGGYGGNAMGGGGRGVVKMEQKGVSFLEHMEIADDSDDDMPETAFEARNKDIAPYAGKLTADGLLLPVSLPGLRDLPPEYDPFQRRELLEVHDEKIPMPGTKGEPMEIDSMGMERGAPGALLPEMFAPGTVARKLLSSESLMFLQIPGLLALTESSSAQRYSLEGDNGAQRVESSVAAAEAAAERMRGLGTDLRRVGEKGTKRPMGKMRFFKSGRVQLVLETGGAIDLEHGIEAKVCQQVVQINARRKTCEELENAMTTRLVGVPALGPT